MKKTLLIAAAALAAGVITSQAQVYSQNVVGYANVVAPVNSVQYLITVPFKVGVSNGINEVLQSAPDYSQVLVWNPNTSGYVTYNRDPSAASGWSDESFTALTSLPTLPPGMGFFFSSPNDNVTNTFVGSVAINVGQTNTTTFPINSVQYLVSCAVPYAGAVTNSSINLNSLPDYSQILAWDPNTSGYKTYNRDPSAATGWSDESFTAMPVPPSISVGQGFFISTPNDGATWKVSLQ